MNSVSSRKLHEFEIICPIGGREGAFALFTYPLQATPFLASTLRREINSVQIRMFCTCSVSIDLKQIAFNSRGSNSTIFIFTFHLNNDQPKRVCSPGSIM